MRNPETGTISQGRNDFSREAAILWLAPRVQADLAQMPEKTRAEAIARAQRIAAEHPNSYLAKYLKRLYGDRQG
jgi:hypothetical protein